MPTPLASHPLAKEWLRQFESNDRGVAESLLTHLRLVPHSEFEEAIANSVQQIVTEAPGLIAVFAINRDIEGADRHSSSADRIGYSLVNLERVDRRRIRANPSVDEMRRTKVKHIVLVDDVCGSGGRVVDFWEQWATRSLKSWLSYHKCTLWLVAFAVHENGVERVLERITYLQRSRIRAVLNLPAIASYPSNAIYRLCETYGPRTGRPRFARGFGGSMSPVVFQHGCPNNTPSILWSQGREWRALFPLRGIPPELYPCFGDTEDGTRNAEILWESGQYKLALEIINAVQFNKKSQRQRLLLTILGLIARNVARDLLPAILTVGERPIAAALAQAMRLGLVNAEWKLTHHGRDILNRARIRRRDQDKIVPTSAWAISGYYPLQSFGVQRNT